MSMPTIKRWLKKGPRNRGRRTQADPRAARLKGAALQEWLPSQLQENDDLTLQEHREVFEEQTGVLVSASTVGGPSPAYPAEAGRSKKSRR